MKWLILGCHGFLGRSFGEWASREGYKVFGVGRRASSPDGWSGGYAVDLIEKCRVCAIINDVQPDAILHAAGGASVAGSFQNPMVDFEMSATLFAKVLEGVRISKCRPLIIFPSSAAVFGQPRDGRPINEDTPCAPMSPYGFHKVCSEALAQSYLENFDIKSVCLRIFSLFGRGQRRLLLWDIFRQVNAGIREVRLLGSGNESRDYLHVDDLSSAIAMLASGVNREQLPARLNVGSGISRPIIDVAKAIVELVNPSASIVCEGNHLPGNPTCWKADVSLFRRLVPEWRPEPFEMRLKDTVEAWGR